MDRLDSDSNLLACNLKSYFREAVFPELQSSDHMTPPTHTHTPNTPPLPLAEAASQHQRVGVSSHLYIELCVCVAGHTSVAFNQPISVAPLPQQIISASPEKKLRKKRSKFHFLIFGRQQRHGSHLLGRDFACASRAH